MKYCCSVWEVDPSCYLDKLQKRICGAVGHKLATCFEPFAHRRNVASLSLFLLTYYFGRCIYELAELVPLPHYHDRSIPHSNRLHDFSVTIPRCYKDIFVNSFIPRTATLWNFLPAECIPLYYDLKSRVTRHLFLWVLSDQLSYMLFILFVLLILFI